MSSNDTGGGALFGDAVSVCHPETSSEPHGAALPPAVEGASRRPASRRARSLWRALASALAVQACSAGALARNPFEESLRGPSRIVLRVQNQNFSDVRLYAETIRGERVLGVVTGNSTKEFTIAWDRLDEIHFRLELLAGSSYTTNSVNVSPGDRLDLVIEQNPRLSVLRRR